MEELYKWVMSLAGASMIAAAARALAPKKRMGKVISLVTGMMLLVVFVSPAVEPDLDALAAELEKYRSFAEESGELVTAANDMAERTIIEEKCEAYILDKARSEGALLEADVDTDYSEDGFWYPSGVKLTGSATEEQRRRIALFIEAELGIASGEQTWSTYDH